MGKRKEEHEEAQNSWCRGEFNKIKDGWEMKSYNDSNFGVGATRQMKTFSPTVKIWIVNWLQVNWNARENLRNVKRETQSGVPLWMKISFSGKKKTPQRQCLSRNEKCDGKWRWQLKANDSEKLVWWQVYGNRKWVGSHLGRVKEVAVVYSGHYKLPGQCVHWYLQEQFNTMLTVGRTRCYSTKGQTGTFLFISMEHIRICFIKYRVQLTCMNGYLLYKSVVS